MIINRLCFDAEINWKAIPFLDEDEELWHLYKLSRNHYEQKI